MIGIQQALRRRMAEQPQQQQYVSLIPPMTSDTTPSGYVASASKVLSATFVAYKAFDGLQDTRALNGRGGGSWWVQITMPTAKRLQRAVVKVSGGGSGSTGYYPAAYALYGAAAGQGFRTIRTGTAQAHGDVLEIPGDGQAYKTYRFMFTAPQPNTQYVATTSIGVAEITLYG